jgi:hypothetical protein
MSEFSPKLALKHTELTDILSGYTSLSHVPKIFNHRHPSVAAPDGHAPRSLCGKGIRTLKDMGDWRIQPDGTWTVHIKADHRTLPGLQWQDPTGTS